MIAQLEMRGIDWPEGPLDAASHFYDEMLPQIRGIVQGNLQGESIPIELEALEGITIIFPKADHSHQSWRLAAIQEMAREIAPLRANLLVAGPDDDISETIEYLASAHGVTGQILTVDAISGERH